MAFIVLSLVTVKGTMIDVSDTVITFSHHCYASEAQDLDLLPSWDVV